MNKRFHVHVSVRDLPASVRFYSTLFGATPSVEKPDYAKWVLEDPRINFAISTRDEKLGVNHLGVQADGLRRVAGGDSPRGRLLRVVAGCEAADRGLELRLRPDRVTRNVLLAEREAA